MWRILLVEDSTDFQLLVKKTLGDRFQLTLCSLILEARRELDRQQFDLILLDIMLPDGSGLELCNELQSDDKTREVPIIFLTAKADVADKMMGFSLGADDYIVKTVDRLEIRARIESKLKKLQSKKEREVFLSKGDFKVSLALQRAYLQDQEIILTPIELKLLTYFLNNLEQVLSREQILSMVWGQNVFVIDRTVDKHISSLRKKLGASAGCLETIASIGYRFSLTSPHQKETA